MQVISPKSSPGPSSATGCRRQSTARRWDRAPVGFVFAAVFRRGVRRLVSLLVSLPKIHLARPALLRAPWGLRARRCFAFENIKRGRAEFTLPADDIASFEMAPDRCVRVFFQELRR